MDGWPHSRKFFQGIKSRKSAGEQVQPQKEKMWKRDQGSEAYGKEMGFVSFFLFNMLGSF